MKMARNFKLAVADKYYKIKYMNSISLEDLEYIALGSTVLGTGGGGDPYIGTLMTREAIRNKGSVPLINVKDLDDDAFVVSIAAFGAPVILLEKLFSGDEFIRAFDMMEKYHNRKIDAIIPAEAGGLNGVIPIGVAATKGIPLVNGDGMGRAFPRLEMVTFTLHGISASPMSQADEKGNTIIYNTIDNVWGETLVGSTTIQMGGSSAIGAFPMNGAQVKKAAVRDIVTFAYNIGKSIIDAKKEQGNALERLLKITDGIQLFEGKISDVKIVADGRWNKGICEILGLNESKGSTMVLDFQNEFLMAKKDGKAVAITPDLIVLLDAENAHPITAETIQYGTRVIVIAMPCNAQWRTPEGIELGGPKKFGYTEAYVPFEELNKKN
tara:strand:- start:306215 stop:307360 length:1146 start_codon:yes stop_codon:yes gene_type:complete